MNKIAALLKANNDPYVPTDDERFQGVAVRKDKNGYYCHTHRIRSRSYPSPDRIPNRAIEFVRSNW